MMKKYLYLVLLSTFLFHQGFAQTAITNNDLRPESPTVSQKNIATINQIDLYPNPVSDFLNVKIQNSTLNNVEFEMYNIIGNSLIVKVEETGNDNYKLDIKDLNPGYYLVIVKDPIKRFNKSYKFQKL